MPLKDWFQHLADGYKIYVERNTFFGTITGFAVVLIHNDICISRYDTAHGYPHRDILGATKGDMGNVPCPEMTMNEVFHHAIRDYEQNYEDYSQFYHKN